MDVWHTILDRYGVVWAVLVFLILQTAGMTWFLLKLVRRLQQDVMRALQELIDQATKPVSYADLIARITVHDLEILRQLMQAPPARHDDEQAQK